MANLGGQWATLKVAHVNSLAHKGYLILDCYPGFGSNANHHIVRVILPGVWTKDDLNKDSNIHDYVINGIGGSRVKNLVVYDLESLN